MFSRFIARLIDLVTLTEYFIRSNWKAVLISLIGLVIALSVISESSLLLNSCRSEFLKETGTYGNRGYLVGDLQFNIANDKPTIEIEKWIDLQKFPDLVYKSLEESNYQHYMRYQCWHTSFKSFFVCYDNKTGGLPTENTTEELNHSIQLKIPDANFFELATKVIEGHFPKNYTEIVIVQFNDENSRLKESLWGRIFPSGIKIGQQMKISLYTENTNLKPHDVTLTISGIIEYDYISWEDQNPDFQSQLIFNYFGSSRRNYYFITSPLFLHELYQEICPKNTEIGLFPCVYGNIFLDYNRFDGFEIDNEIFKLDSFYNRIKTNFYDAGFSLRFEDEFKFTLEAFRDEMSMYGALFYVLSVPVIGIALYLVSYSFGLIRRQKRGKIGILKTRGASSWHIFIFLLGELVLGIILAIIGGIIFGYLLTGIVLRSVNLLDFSGKGKTVIFTERIINDLVLWGVLFAIGLQFLNIVRTSRTNILASIEPVDKTPPIWNRYYFDIWTTGLGLIGLFLIFSFFSMDPEQMPDDFYELFLILIISAPFLMFIGLIFLLSRLFPLISKYLAVVFWKFSGGVAAFALKSVVRHKHSANRTVIVVTLALTYTVFSGTFMHFLDINSKLMFYSDVGADIYISTPFNDTLSTLIQDLDDIKAFSGRAYGFIEVAIQKYSILFVDPETFTSTAYFKENVFGISSSLVNLMSAIKDNKTIILHESNLKADRNLDIGGFLRLKYSKGFVQKEIPLEIAGTFRYWPGLYVESKEEDSFFYHYYIIGSLGLFQTLYNLNLFSHSNTGYIISLKENVNPENVISEIQSITKQPTNSPIIQYLNYMKSFNRRFIVSILNSDLLICITVAIVSITMFALFTFIERSKEIGVERALGMTKFQLSTTFIIEGGIIMIFGVITGLAIGLFYSTIVMKLFTTPSYSNLVIIEYPIEFLIKVISGLLLASIIATLLPAHLASKKDISYILKAE